MRRSLLFLSLTVFSLLACQISEEERIGQVVNRREEALRKKDLSLYLSCISKTYHGKDEDFDRLRSRIEGYFNTFDRIEYTSWGRSIQIEGDTARVIQEFYLEVEKEGRKDRYKGKEALSLTRHGREWKITGGL
jgi:ketosteroid isomerase-like protein